MDEKPAYFTQNTPENSKKALLFLRKETERAIFAPFIDRKKLLSPTIFLLHNFTNGRHTPVFPARLVLYSPTNNSISPVYTIKLKNLNSLYRQ